jgi:hypothetical protein
MARRLPDPLRPSRRASAAPTPAFGDRVSRLLRWAVVVAAAVLPYAGPRLVRAAPAATSAGISQAAESR